jgi:purine-binding chemotaxis protein CheW
LPELSPIEELPAYIAGVFDLRGTIVPVMDLGLRFGHAPAPWLSSDRVIVIASGTATVGIVVNELHDVLALPQSAIEAARSYCGAGGQPRYVCGEARLDDALVMLLDVDALLHDGVAQAARALPPPADSAAARSAVPGTHAPEAVELFRNRARNLARIQATCDRTGLEAFAVIRLEDELFALCLDNVREFCHLRDIVPVPCCPTHIVGNMNLRGDILTLVDIRPALGLTTGGAMREVVVARMGETQFGLPAAQIVDVLHLAPADIASIPVASNRAGKAYCNGITTVEGQSIGILDLDKILAAGELRVAENV